MPMSSEDKQAMSEPQSKPFPWKCAECGARAVMPVTVAYAVDMEYDGRTYPVEVPDLVAPQCSQCRAIVVDDAANRQLSAALRETLGILTPQQIRTNREALGLTQKQLANCLGVADATISRWETGAQIQQRAMDRLLRLFFGFSSVRTALQDDVCLASLGSKPLRQDDCERAERFSRLAARLDTLPPEKEQEVEEVLDRLVSLM
jgi:putative zinc finger/helix-turn-helix YgiT family protein